jgi:putative SOS response-associated peptidase YedK
MGPNGEEMETAAIVTTRANAEIANLHSRMPTIILEREFDLWLDCGAFDEVAAAAPLEPAPEGLLEAYEISTAVNRTANDGPELIVPAPADQPPPAPLPRKRATVKDECQPSLFDDL